MIKYKLINNNRKELVIVFQSAGRITLELFDKIINNDVELSEVKKAHEKYSWYKLKENTYVDYLYLEDFYSKSYGWYMFDEGNSIIDKLNLHLERFIIDNKYKKVTAFGSSKGGTGALLYGIKNPYINRVFSVVPQIHSVQYIDTYFEKYKKLFFPKDDIDNEEYFNNIFYNEDLYCEENYRNTSVYIYTGVGDEQFQAALDFNNFLGKKNIDNNIIINSSQKKHTPIVMDNVPFVRSALKIIHNGDVMRGPRLFNVDRRSYILKDK
ncbi:hypothetical protein [Psychrobacter immobilis]|uniref:hypothetical protein n=1 Tax=Psychrobacter immobilis TaxID=498 RepID=UPI00191B3A5B|nr:hypothetical protein [Psychrobacter immobilis]